MSLFFDDAVYILPVRHTTGDATSGLETYLAWLCQRIAVIVVDGSDSPVFEQHALSWQGVRHVRPADDIYARNGKVHGVLTGLRLTHESKVVIADDDVRYDEISLAAGLRLLDSADVIRPQNYFEPMPWHARWDTARTLLNRATGGDWPGTLLVRRQILEKTNGYDGDCLFENLELVRTVKAAGGTEHVALDLFVRREPPSPAHFLSQRVRQAYDEFARPERLAGQLALLPTSAVLALKAPRLLASLVVGSVLLAEFGRRRAGGSSVFPASASLFAPLWLLERMVCSWWAVFFRLTKGGVPYSGGVLQKAASDPKALLARHGDASLQKVAAR